MSRPLFLVLLIQALISIQVVQPFDDDNSEFVQEILDESDEHVNDFASMNDEQYEQELRRQQEQYEQRVRQQEEQVRLERERNNERIRQQREAEIQRAVDRMDDTQKKDFRKQQKQDGKVVQQVLKQAKKNNLYGILGLLNNRDIVLLKQRSLSIPLIGKSIRIPEVRFLTVSNTQIKRAFRQMAKSVHPDRNRDPRATEAFVYVEEAASVLLDQSSRHNYDAMIQHHRKLQHDRLQTLLNGNLNKVAAFCRYGTAIVKKIVGPFAIPLFIVSVLVV